jgi:hypothetical protein
MISVECYTFKPLNSHVLYLSLCCYLMFYCVLVFVLFSGLKENSNHIMDFKLEDNFDELKCCQRLGARAPISGARAPDARAPNPGARAPSYLPELEDIFVTANDGKIFWGLILRLVSQL